MTLTFEEAKQQMPPMWTVFAFPLDYPDKFVVRMFYGEYPTSLFSLHPDLHAARTHLVRVLGASVKLARHPHDDPKIVETWI